MKVCPVCKSAVPDDAEYCDTCGNDEFFDGYSQQFEQPYQNGYEQPYQNGYEQQPQYDYNQPQYQQPQQQYGYQQNQYQPQSQYDYNQQQYQQQPPQPQYDYNQQQYQQPQYEQEQYAQPQYQEQYEQPQYQEQYEQPQYQEQYEQPVEEQQPVIEEPVVEEVQPSEEEQTVTEEPVAEEPSVEEQPVEEEVPEEPKENPHEMSKNFVYEKKEQQQPQPQNTEKPKGIKGYLSMFLNTKDHTIEFDKDDIAKNSKNAILASFGITFWLPFIQKDYSRYARYYGNQGLLTLILMIPCTILYSLITGVVICNACTAAVYQNGVATFKYLTFGGWIAAIIFFAICYAIPIFIIYLSVTNIKQGKAKDIPLIGALRLIS